MNDRPSADEHRRRMERGVGAVCEYLQAQFPSHVVEALDRGSRNSDRRVRTFRVRKDSEEYLLRVGDEVLDLDAEATSKDRKSTRLNSSHEWISYAVFCLKKK